ncbi:MAG: metallophosphoesterase [Deltaproteobacteria bacterium]|nr:metallophosphoesterase [Deltaproteobacteria bacterium]
MRGTAYLTDVEGRWDKLTTFAEANALVSLIDGRLVLADGATFVFGGDAIDRGPDARRIVALFLDAKARYGDRVVLLAGNRDLNKLRLVRELDGHPPTRTPDALRSGPRGALLRWICAHTMGAPDAFEHRSRELANDGVAHDDEAVVESFLADLGPSGALRRYLAACQLAHRDGETLYLHGAITDESHGVLPGVARRIDSVDDWVEALNAFHSREIEAFEAGREPSAVIAYQAPLPGTRANQASVVYGRPADALGNPLLPGEATRAFLRRGEIRRVVVGHTPSGDCPAIVRDDALELVLADNAYGRIERGSQVTIESERLHIAARTRLDDGTERTIRSSTSLTDRGPLGLRDASTGQLVKSRLEDGDYLLFRALPNNAVEQKAASEIDVDARSLEPAR